MPHTMQAHTPSEAQTELLFGFTVDPTLEAQLSHFDLGTRQAALAALLAKSPQARPPAALANLHCHTFFSYNAYGLSPTALAWLARQRGIPLLGIVDFDTLDGVDEFLEACDATGVRGVAGLETRVFVPEFADVEINSPGEPGVLYHMGVGFTQSSVTESITDATADATADANPAAILTELGEQSTQRNQGLIQRINAYLAPVIIDYHGDVLPLTPGGNATERHIVAAYLTAAANHFAEAAALAGFWADRLQLAPEAVAALLQDGLALQNQVRAKLMKRGGVGYVQPDHATFPPLDRFHTLVKACGALPCVAWLDGASPGEQRMEELLDLLIAQGVAALNIIPDRNWNYADPQVQQTKVAALYAVVELAQARDLPILVGTEMNSFGQKLIDDFDAAPMRLLRRTFLDGAYVLYGHTALQGHAGLGYASAWAQAHLPQRDARNQFFAQVGRALSPGAIVPSTRESMIELSGHNATPTEILQAVSSRR